ncbi:MAG: hypothetical protein WCI74_09040, partial [Actinomycetes bacterium]
MRRRLSILGITATVALLLLGMTACTTATPSDGPPSSASSQGSSTEAGVDGQVAAFKTAASAAGYVV